MKMKTRPGPSNEPWDLRMKMLSKCQYYLNYLNEKGQILEKHKLPKLTQGETISK